MPDNTPFGMEDGLGKAPLEAGGNTMPSATHRVTKKFFWFLKIAAICITAVIFGRFLWGEHQKNEDVGIVQNSTLNFEGPIPIGRAVSGLAGVTGSTDWFSFTPAKYGDQVRCVEVDVISRQSEKTPKYYKFQFLLNRTTQYVEMAYFGEDDVAKSKFEGLMALKLSQ